MKYALLFFVSSIWISLLFINARLSIIIDLLAK